MRALPMWTLVLLAACSNSGGSATLDAASTDSIAADASDAVDMPGGQCSPPAGLGRGLQWVRANPMVISGLSVVMGTPSMAAVDEYFDTFHATAVHTWQNGLPSEIAGWNAAGHAGFRYVSWVKADGTSAENALVLGGAPALAGRIGYQISDEPTDMAAFNAVIAGAQVVKAADPDGLRIVNLNDSSGANSLRTQVAQHPDVDVLSYDHYTWGTKANGGLASTRAAAIAAGKPYWRYMKSFYYKTDAPEGAESDLRWDAFVGAVYGFTGYSWFVYSIDAGNADLGPLLYTAGGNFAATKTAQWGYAAAINAQLVQLGKSLAVLRSTDVRYVPRYANLSGISTWSAGAGGEPYLESVTVGSSDGLVGTFRDDCDEPYVMVQNQAHAAGDFPNNSSSARTITLVFDFAAATDPTLDRTRLRSLDLSTGSIIDIALTSTGATTATVDISIPAGGVVLFKYATSRPFASQ